MAVDRAATDVTLEYVDALHGLCDGRYRRVFADEHGVPLTARCGHPCPGLTDR